MALGIRNGSEGGSVISFLDAPRELAGKYVSLEPKVCETCGCTFYRPVQHAKAYGPRFCRRVGCKAKGSIEDDE